MQVKYIKYCIIFVIAPAFIALCLWWATIVFGGYTRPTCRSAIERQVIAAHSIREVYLEADVIKNTSCRYHLAHLRDVLGADYPARDYTVYSEITPLEPCYTSGNYFLFQKHPAIYDLSATEKFNCVHAYLLPKSQEREILDALK